ncbi:MAG: DUF4157 domain-containing protein [Chloroflexota bacterium]
MRTVQKPAETIMIVARPSISSEPAPDEETLLSEQMNDGGALGHRLEALRIGASDDHYEQEADRVAEQVVERWESGSGPSAPVQATPTPGPAVQAKGAGGAGSGSAAALTQLPPAPGSGRPLEASVRTPMERAFGSSLGDVRLHTTGQAQQLNQSLDARATTVGQDIYFDKGEYNPDSTSGRELLAHELTHVLQQRHGGARFQKQGKGKRKKGKEEAEDTESLLGESSARSDEAEEGQPGPSSSTKKPKKGKVEMALETANRIRVNAQEMIVLHQNYKRFQDSLDKPQLRVLKKIFKVAKKIIKIVEKFDASGTTKIVRVSLNLLSKLAEYFLEARRLLDEGLRLQLQPLIEGKVDIKALIKEAVSLEKAVKAVADAI